jgi:hypothetical protein
LKKLLFKERGIFDSYVKSNIYSIVLKMRKVKDHDGEMQMENIKEEKIF